MTSIVKKKKGEKMKINLKSYITTGIIAGIIINISAITMVPVVGNEMDYVLAERGLPPLSNIDMLYFCVISFFYGMFLIFLYVLLKPWLKLKIKTVIISSIMLWVVAYLFSNGALVVYGFMPIKLTVIGTIWGLLELLLAGTIGSILYKEKN